MKFLKNSLLSFLFCALLSANSMHSTQPMSFVMGALLTTAMLARLQTPLLQPRFHIHQLMRPTTMKFGDYLQQVRYCITDGLIGHVGKKDRNNQWIIKPYGLCGLLHAKIPFTSLIGLSGSYWGLQLFFHLNKLLVKPKGNHPKEKQNIIITAKAHPTNKAKIIDLTNDDANLTQLNVPEQRDGHTCGDRAVCMAKAISQLIQEEQVFNHATINQRFEELFQTHAPYREREAYGYLRGQQVYDFAALINLESVHLFNTNTQLYLREARGTNHEVARAQLNELFHQLHTNPIRQVAHFIYNQNGNHWVLFTVIKEQQTTRIMYADSFNRPITATRGTEQFAQQLQRSLAAGQSFF